MMHEVQNGMLLRKDAKEIFHIPIGPVPCGSGNALCKKI